MGISGPESVTSSVENHTSTHDRELDPLSFQNEIDHLRAAKKQAEIKLQLLRKRYEEEASLFTESRVNNIFKINGAREYLESLRDKIRIKDETINNLKEDLEFKRREISELQERFREAEKRSREYLKAWKDAQRARERLEIERKASPIMKDTTRMLSHSANMSSASSLNGSQVPPPPPIDVPTVDEILRGGGGALSSREQISPYVSLDSSIPPPPDIDVPLEELTSNRRAFVQEKGQFLCHVYATVELESSKEILSDIVELVSEKVTNPTQTGYSSNYVRASYESSDSPGVASDQFHVTLIRGHRAIHYHQISQMLSCIEAECKNSRSFCLYLNKLRFFNNHENTKQFLCLTTRDNNSETSSDMAHLMSLKRKLCDTIDQFATRLTDEDETDDTLAHCSLMYREMNRAEQSQDQLASDIAQIEELCLEYLAEYPMCVVKVDKINVKIGNRIYEYSLVH